MWPMVQPWKVSVVALALLSPALGCKRFLRVFSAEPQQGPMPNAALDTPPPLHTGGLDVLGSTPEGQGPGRSPGTHGSPVAEGIATGVGVLTIGATATKTAMKCTQPGATVACLRGPGPGDGAGDAGTP